MLSASVPSSTSSVIFTSSTLSGSSGARKLVFDLSTFKAFLSTFFLQLKLLGVRPETIATIPRTPKTPTTPIAINET